jgi:hypothetical protein
MGKASTLPAKHSKKNIYSMSGEILGIIKLILLKHTQKLINYSYVNLFLFLILLLAMLFSSCSDDGVTIKSTNEPLSIKDSAIFDWEFLEFIPSCWCCHQQQKDVRR